MKALCTLSFAFILFLSSFAQQNQALLSFGVGNSLYSSGEHFSVDMQYQRLLLGELSAFGSFGMILNSRPYAFNGTSFGVQGSYSIDRSETISIADIGLEFPFWNIGTRFQMLARLGASVIYSDLDYAYESTIQMFTVLEERRTRHRTISGALLIGIQNEYQWSDQWSINMQLNVRPILSGNPEVTETRRSLSPDGFPVGSSGSIIEAQSNLFNATLGVGYKF